MRLHHIAAAAALAMLVLAVVDLELAKVVATGAGFVATVAFMVTFHRVTAHRGRAPWHASQTGRNLMLKAAAVASLATVSLLSRVDEVTGLPIKDYLGPLLVAAYSGVGYAYARWIRAVLREHDDGSRR